MKTGATVFSTGEKVEKTSRTQNKKKKIERKNKQKNKSVNIYKCKLSLS